MDDFDFASSPFPMLGGRADALLGVRIGDAGSDSELEVFNWVRFVSKQVANFEPAGRETERGVDAFVGDELAPADAAAAELYVGESMIFRVLL